MTRPKHTKTQSVSIRIPNALLRKVDRRACAAGLDRSPYIVRIVAGRVPDETPLLAALAQLASMRAAVVSSASISDVQLVTLDKLVQEISLLARNEAMR